MNDNQHAINQAAPQEGSVSTRWQALLARAAALAAATAAPAVRAQARGVRVVP